MVYWPNDWSEHQWTITNEGVVRVSDRPLGAKGEHIYVVHGLVVRICPESAEPRKGRKWNGGFVTFILSDSRGDQRTLDLSRDYLCLDNITNAGQGKFMFDIMEAQRDCDQFIPQDIFWGALFCCGA